MNLELGIISLLNCPLYSSLYFVLLAKFMECIIAFLVRQTNTFYGL